MSDVWGHKFTNYIGVPEDARDLRPLSEMIEHRMREESLEWLDHKIYRLDPEQLPALIAYWTEQEGTEIRINAQLSPDDGWGRVPEYATTMILARDKYDEFCKRYEARYDCKEGPDDESGRETAGCQG